MTGEDPSLSSTGALAGDPGLPTGGAGTGFGSESASYGTGVPADLAGGLGFTGFTSGPTDHGSTDSGLPA